MNDPFYDELMRLSLRRELSPDDELRVRAFLTAHPEMREDWEENVALGRAMGSLREAPVSSNFTSQVLHAVDLEVQRTQRVRAVPSAWGRWRQMFRPRLSWSAGVVIAALLLGYQYREISRDKAARQMASDVQLVSESLARLPDPKVLRDFDAINQLRYVSAVSDDELLIALQAP